LLGNKKEKWVMLVTKVTRDGVLGWRCKRQDDPGPGTSKKLLNFGMEGLAKSMHYDAIFEGEEENWTINAPGLLTPHRKVEPDDDAIRFHQREKIGIAVRSQAAPLAVVACKHGLMNFNKPELGELFNYWEVEYEGRKPGTEIPLAVACIRNDVGEDWTDEQMREALAFRGKAVTPEAVAKQLVTLQNEDLCDSVMEELGDSDLEDEIRKLKETTRKAREKNAKKERAFLPLARNAGGGAAGGKGGGGSSASSSGSGGLPLEFINVVYSSGAVDGVQVSVA